MVDMREWLIIIQRITCIPSAACTSPW